jgi:stage V sporulation protein SpoVS
LSATPTPADPAAIDLVFASPRRLPKPASLRGRVVVLDVAFAAEGIGSGFDKITGKFLTGLGPRLARWVDHHDHERHAHFRGDRRFVLHTKAEHGACPEIITPEMVEETGPVDTIVAHFDLDGLYSAAKWLLGGVEPYPGADADARAVDTRVGDVGPIGQLVDKALRAHYEDTVLLNKIVRWLVAGMPRGPEQEAIAAAAADFDAMAAEAAAIARDYVVEDDIALVRVPSGARPFDKTELLLLGQRRATVAVVVDGQTINIAAGFESGLDFVALLGLGGGMPTRVSVPASRLADTLAKIRAALRERG